MEGAPADRTRDWVFQQKVEEIRTLTSGSATILDTTGQTAGQAFHSKTLDSAVTRLQLIAGRISSMTCGAAGRYGYL